MLTVGQLFKQTRKYKGVSLEEIAADTRINIKYLKQIENDSFDDSKAQSHIYGFIKNYAKYLDLDTKKVLAIYKRQVKKVEKGIVKKKSGTDIINTKKSLVFTPAMIGIVILILFLVGVFGYLIRQFYKLQQPPVLEIVEPTEQEVVVNQPEVTIKGVTETNVYLILNEQQIKYEEDGTFTVAVPLHQEENIITITAQNRQNEDKKTTKEIKVIYKKSGTSNQQSEDGVDSGEGESSPDQVTEMKIEMQIKGGDAWIQIVCDDVQKGVGVFPSGTKKKYKAKERFYVSTGRPSITKILVNGQKIDWKIKKGVGGIDCSLDNGEVVCK